MHQRFKQNPLAIGVLTGVTALVGGIEPAAADFLPPQSKSFGTITVSDTGGSGGPSSGNFSDTGSDPTEFSQFDDLGGSRVLTGVTVTVTSSTSVVQALVNGNCTIFAESSTTCGATAHNDSTFSASISLDPLFTFTPLSQPLSVTATDSCESSFGEICNYADEPSDSTLLGPFTFTATAGQLGQFVGLGAFDVTPKVDLAGAYSWFAGTADENFSELGASTVWLGTIEVDYEYREVPNGVPEPASLFLVGAGLAGLGFARRKRQHG